MVTLMFSVRIANGVQMHRINVEFYAEEKMSRSKSVEYEGKNRG